MAGNAAPPMGSPPMALADYLAAEQRLGRVRGDIDPWQVTTVVLAALFGLGVAPDVGGRADAIDLLASLVANGLGAGEPRSEQRADR